MPVSKTIDIEKALEIFEYQPTLGGSKLVWKINYKRGRAGAMAGCQDNHGVWRVKMNGESFRAHRIAYAITKGTQPPEDLPQAWDK